MRSPLSSITLFESLYVMIYVWWPDLAHKKTGGSPRFPYDNTHRGAELNLSAPFYLLTLHKSEELSIRLHDDQVVLAVKDIFVGIHAAIKAIEFRIFLIGAGID